jgi:hypothetical protein
MAIRSGAGIILQTRIAGPGGNIGPEILSQPDGCLGRQT